MKERRYIYARYDEGWKNLNPVYNSMVQDIIKYVDRKYSFRILH